MKLRVDRRIGFKVGCEVDLVQERIDIGLCFFGQDREGKVQVFKRLGYNVNEFWKLG